MINLAYNNIKSIFLEDIQNINILIKNNLKSNITLINNISNYLTEYNGKKIRSLTNILLGKLFQNYNAKNITLSTVIELIHTATLLHDDVVDQSQKRRGKITTNYVWGNKEAILVGDFLYTKSFKIMIEIGNIEILKIISKTTNTMSKGEINQLINKKNINITEIDYFNTIKCKTAELFGAGALSSAILSNCEIKYFEPAYLFGIHFGIAYQLIDDVLDYLGENTKLDKNAYDDLISGTLTLPLIKLIEEDVNIKKLIIKMILENCENEFLIIKNFIIKTYVIDYTFKMALYHIDKAKNALSIFPKSIFSEYILKLSNFIIERKY